MAILSFISMYALMYAMVDTFGNIYPNNNQLYMAGLTTSPMIIIELVLMRAMYKKKKRNVLIVIGSIAALSAFFLFIRNQTAIDNRQFAKSMTVHHAAALLMCEKAQLDDPELIELCKEIHESQQAQIDQMKAILARLDE